MEFKQMQAMLQQTGQQKKIIVEMQCEIAHLEQQKEWLKEYKAIQLTEMLTGISDIDSVAERITHLEKLETKITNIISKIQYLLKQNKKLMLLIFQVLTPDEYAVIKERYLNGYRWNFIFAKTMSSRSTCIRLHNKAIKKLIEEWEKQEKDYLTK